jgi:hypothetical protein
MSWRQPPQPPGEAPIPVVYASSAAVYGDNTALPLTETAVPRPLSPYAIDKLASESYAQAAGRQRALPTVGLRFFNVYGPRQNPCSPSSGVISIFADRAVRGDTVQIHGDGEQTRDFSPRRGRRGRSAARLASRALRRVKGRSFQCLYRTSGIDCPARKKNNCAHRPRFTAALRTFPRRRCATIGW